MHKLLENSGIWFHNLDARGLIK